MMKKEKYILIMLSLFICAYLFSNRMTPRIENIASKEINQFIQILINHTSFTQKIDTHKLYKKENNSISFQMNYINDIASNYIHNLEETLLKLEEGSYQENNHSPYNKKLLKINQQKGIVARIPIGSLTNNIFLQDRGPSFSIKYKTTLQAPGYLEAMGLDHYEYQCGRGVKVSDKIAFALKDKAKEHNITLSLHAPYFISLSSLEAEKRDNSINYILQSCDAASRMGADRIVIHSGSCAKISRVDALELAKDTLTRARETAVEQGFEHIVFCPETMGKVNQLGNLTEVLELCKLDDTFLPTIDFGHLNAREFGYIKGKAEYEKMLDEVENAIGHDRLKIFHSHFSKIMFTNPGGEKKHLTFDDNQGFGPDYEPLMEIVAKKDLSPIFICESAGTQDKDALTMKNYYLSVK